MSLLIKLIGLVLGFTIITQAASTPITELLRVNPVKIEVIPPIKPSFTPDPVKEPLKVEKYPEMRSFLDSIPKCDWCVACGSYSRYTSLEAEKYGIELHEITITASNIGLINMMDGHRVNCFYNGDERVYVDNMYGYGVILERNELKKHLKNFMGIDANKIGFKNVKYWNRSNL